MLFDSLKSEHGLDRRARLLLEVAAILHDIGMFIRNSGHHKHSQYIIANSEIFGLHRDDLEVISNVVRYHRKAPPNSTHIAYIALQREERMLVLKLASLLRVADALDRGIPSGSKPLRWNAAPIRSSCALPAATTCPWSVSD
jgi:exopolyphosphatase/guanosine-5'-triphosphate,3'-diphosphate pyrophosphatase